MVGQAIQLPGELVVDSQGTELFSQELPRVCIELFCYSFTCNRPYSYSQYWTGTSLQWRLMRGNILKMICI